MRTVGVLWLWSVSTITGAATPLDGMDGSALMSAVYARHQLFPYVYEEQSVILIDRHGARETRKARRYSRSRDGRTQLLLLFDSPRELRGVALLSGYAADGRIGYAVYLPAFADTLLSSSNVAGAAGLLGTDFTVEDVLGERLEDHEYVRVRDVEIDHVWHFVVDSYRRGDDPDRSAPARRHYILKDNLYIVRTDQFDGRGHLVKRRRNHDLQRVHGNMWRANLMLMDNLLTGHRTVLKIDRRVFSEDYVPAEVFRAEWLYANAPERRPVDAAEDGR